MADEIKDFEMFTKFIKKKSNDGVNTVLVLGASYVDFDQINTKINEFGVDKSKIRKLASGEQIQSPNEISNFHFLVGVPDAIDEVMTMIDKPVIAILVSYSKDMLRSIQANSETVTERSGKDIEYNELYAKVRNGQLLRSEVQTLTTLILHVVFDIQENMNTKLPEIKDKSISGTSGGEIIEENVEEVN